VSHVDVRRIESRLVDEATGESSTVVEGGDVLEVPEQPSGRRATSALAIVDGVLAVPSSSLERSYASAEDVLRDVLDQFARNFLLNDLSEEKSQKLVEGTKVDVTFALPRREPRRRDSALEQVHQARVSIRRLRSTLRTYGELFNPEWSTPLVTELSWYAAVLGEVRDLDVLRDAITKTLWHIDDARIQTLVSSRLDRQRELAQDRIAIEKSTKRYASLVDEIAAMSTCAQFVEQRQGPAGEVLRHEVRHTWRQVKRFRRKARHEPSVERLHRMRIELKRLQCACEVVALVETKLAQKVAQAAASAQSHLGVVHDEAVASAWLRTLVVAEPRLKQPLRTIIKAHERARLEAEDGWLDELAKVERRWDLWDICPAKSS
jgi:CHAD domain-containing protein